MSWLNRAILLLVGVSFVISAAYSAEVQVRGPKNSKPSISTNNANNRNSSNSNSNSNSNSTNNGNGTSNNNSYSSNNSTYDINTITNSDGSITLSDYTYGPITSADTLWQIANRFKGNNNLSVYQAMYAIYQLNPNAFENSNLNLIKDGFVLELPSEKYIASINKADAIMRFETDTARLKELGIKQGTAPIAKSPAEATSNVSKNELDETKQLIEQKLGALDEAQTRQFMAIRQQFAESITNVQAILDENQKLFERLDSVNTDINEMRSHELTKTQQMTQIGQSLEELLAKSREQDAAQQIVDAQDKASWLDDTLLLIGVSSIPALLILGGFAYWLIRRNADKSKSPMHLVEDDDIELDEHTSALDDLSDALSDELSDELDDDNLFGEDDLLDDVLAEELSESLDEALDESLDDSIDAELDSFDDLGDDLLEPEEPKDEFEEGSAQIEQSELDSLFDEDDDLSTDQNDGVSEAELIDTELAAEADGPEVAKTAKVLKDPPAGIIAQVTDQEEAPEISIDELFEGSETKIVPSIEVDDSEEVNEEMLQQLDKEIAAQNAELDNITGNLLDELEQVEQMRDLLGDDDGEEEDAVDVNQIVQPGIKKLDEDSLADGFDEQGGFEPDFLDVLDEDQDDSPAESTAQAGKVAAPLDKERKEGHVSEDLTEFVEYETDDEEQEVDSVAQSDQSTPIADDELSDIEDIQSKQTATAESEIKLTNEAEKLAVEPEAEIAEAELPSSESPEAAAAGIESATDSTDDAAELAIEPEAELAEPETSASGLHESGDSETTANEESDEFDTDGDEEEPSQQELNKHANDDHGLDEDELEKALEDFEHQELDEVLEDLTSNKSSALDLLDDLEFGMVADDFMQHKTADKTIPPDAAVVDSDEELDDSLLEQALADLDEQEDDFAPEQQSDELDDLPGLGDWLTESPDSSKKTAKKSAKNKPSSEDESLLDELEEANFDELLSAINLDEEDEPTELDGLDISALLSEVPESSVKPVEPESDDNEDDFLDVEALLNDSDDSDYPADKDLDLATPLASFFGDSADGDSVDVDGDNGIGAKMDLAHAYIEIGENESAIELLEEIIASGNEQQKSEAKTIINSLSAL
jgi:pilus assembly protein FimV